MAAIRILRSSSFSQSPIIKSLISQSSRSISTSKPRSHYHHNQEEEEYSKPCEYLGSWKPAKNPKEAQAQLAMLRRDYAEQMKELRREYFYEMELQRQEKQLKDEAKKEAIRIAKEERKAAKAALSQAKAAERKVIQDEFRQTLRKERAEKLEYWRMREKKVEEKKNEKKELLRKQSSMWVREKELESKIHEAIIGYSQL